MSGRPQSGYGKPCGLSDEGEVFAILVTDIICNLRRPLEDQEQEREDHGKRRAQVLRLVRNALGRAWSGVLPGGSPWEAFPVGARLFVERLNGVLERLSAIAERYSGRHRIPANLGGSFIRYHCALDQVDYLDRQIKRLHDLILAMADTAHHARVGTFDDPPVSDEE